MYVDVSLELWMADINMIKAELINSGNTAIYQIPVDGFGWIYLLKAGRFTFQSKSN